MHPRQTDIIRLACVMHINTWRLPAVGFCRVLASRTPKLQGDFKPPQTLHARDQKGCCFAPEAHDGREGALLGPLGERSVQEAV